MFVVFNMIRKVENNIVISETRVLKFVRDNKLLVSIFLQSITYQSLLTFTLKK